MCTRSSCQPAARRAVDRGDAQFSASSNIDPVIISQVQVASAQPLFVQIDTLQSPHDPAHWAGCSLSSNGFQFASIDSFLVRVFSHHRNGAPAEAVLRVAATSRYIRFSSCFSDTNSRNSAAVGNSGCSPVDATAVLP